MVILDLGFGPRLRLRRLDLFSIHFDLRWSKIENDVPNEELKHKPARQHPQSEGPSSETQEPHNHERCEPASQKHGFRMREFNPKQGSASRAGCRFLYAYGRGWKRRAAYRTFQCVSNQHWRSFSKTKSETVYLSSYSRSWERLHRLAALVRGNPLRVSVYSRPGTSPILLWTTALRVDSRINEVSGFGVYQDFAAIWSILLLNRCLSIGV
jgi:hypothetical protein